MNKTNYLVVLCTVIICVSLLIFSYQNGIEKIPETTKAKEFTRGVVRNVTLNGETYGIYFENGEVLFLNKYNNTDKFVLGKRTEVIHRDGFLESVEFLESQGSVGPIGSEKK